MKFIEESKVSVNNLIGLPKEVREFLESKPGDRIIFLLDDDNIIVKCKKKSEMEEEWKKKK